MRLPLARELPAKATHPISKFRKASPLLFDFDLHRTRLCTKRRRPISGWRSTPTQCAERKRLCDLQTLLRKATIARGGRYAVRHNQGLARHGLNDRQRKPRPGGRLAALG